MQVEVKQVLNDINYMSEIINQIYFSTNESDRWFVGMPRIDKWNVGVVRLNINNNNVAEIIKVLARYGITAKDGAPYPNEVLFECSADNDIIKMISQALSMRRMRMKSMMLDTLSSEVEQVSKQTPYVQSSLFSRGVKNLRNGVDTLKNVVVAQQKTLRR